MILIIDNYDSFTFNLVQYIGEMEADIMVRRNDKIRLDEIENQQPDGIVISPGPGRPENAGISVALVREFAGQIPILGVCLGHQAIAVNYGGKIVPARELLHGKTSPVFHQDTALFRRMSNPFVATRYHSLTVDRTTLPEELKIIAETREADIMALQHRSLPLYGVQFHPEAIQTTEGKNILRNFIHICQSPPIKSQN